MEKARVSEPNQDKVKSLSHALEVLNGAADDSAEEIRRMINTDYNKLKNVLSEVKPNVRSAFGEVKEVTAETVSQAKDKVVTATKETAQKVDESVHKNPWIYLGGVATVSTLAGFLLGRKTKH